MLQQSPSVQSLGSSRSEESYEMTLLETDREEAGSLLCRICASFTNDSPVLNLELLHVGYGIDFPAWPLVSHLTNLQALEDLAMWNRQVVLAGS